MYRILYNPLAAHGQGNRKIELLKEMLKGRECLYEDIREVNYTALCKELKPNDRLVVAGGDGTLNRFVNAIGDNLLENEIYYFAAGSGNDFYHDVSKEPNKLIRINSYIKDLPTVSVNGTERRFINGIGFGIDGYCCEEGDRIARTSERPVNYTSIAIKGLLFRYTPTNARITVDGKTVCFDQVWLAPTMNGRCYGGGLMITPKQDRLSKDRMLSVAVLHGSGRIRTLSVFPSIFKGEHVRHADIFEVFRGREITVEFDRPTALQIDGETVRGVRTYSVRSAKPAIIAPTT
jgi:diacylglycerol kinase family enzyme